MKSKLSKIMAGIFVCFAIMMMYNINANAANANVNVSSASGSVGDTVIVNVDVTPEVAANAKIALAYDTNYLECVGGGNGGAAGIVMNTLDIAEGTSGTMAVSFKLKKEGTAAVTISDANTTITATSDNSALNINKADGTVTVNAATGASGDSRLSGIVVQAVSQNGDSRTINLTPNFSPDVYEYKADLPSSVIKLVVATTLSDKNSTTKVSGTRIDPGDNKTTITVVAQDGSQSKYTLYSTRLNENETPANPDSAEVSSELQTTDFDRSPKLISAISKYIIQDFSLVSIPEGFEESTTIYNGETVAAARGITKELVLLCLADDTQGSNAAFYIYNEASGSIDKMINITSAQNMYTIIPTGDDYAGPEGYTKTELEVDGERVTAWVKSPDSGFYVVYAMNQDGEKVLYIYDSKEHTMQRFIEGAKSENVSDEPAPENKEYLSMKKQYDDMYKEYVDDHSKKNKIIIALGIIVICAMLGIAALLYKNRSKHQDFAEENSDDDELEEIGSEHEQKELKLDMVAQVNEQKEERIAEQFSNSMDKVDLEEDMEAAKDSKSSKDIETDGFMDDNDTCDSDNQINIIEDDSETDVSDDYKNDIKSYESDYIKDNTKENVDSVIKDDTEVNATSDVKLVVETDVMNDTKAAAGTNGANDVKATAGTNRANDVKATAGEDRTSDSKEDLKKDEPYLINMEDDDPFEIEFVDLNDSDDTK